MKYIAVFCLFIATLAGCTTNPPAPNPIGCSLEQVVSGSAAAAVATALQCSNLTAMQADFQNALGSINFCAAATAHQKALAMHKGPVSTPVSKPGQKVKGAIGSIICPLATDSIVGLLNANIPATWNCQVDQTSGLASIISQACINAVPF